MNYQRGVRLTKMVAVLGLLGHAGVAMATSGSFEKSVAIDGAAIIDVSNTNGAVVVQGADVDEVTISARIKIDKRYSKSDPTRAARIIAAIKRSPPIEVEGSRVSVNTLSKHTHKRYASISYEILVPRDADINVHTVSGNVRVSGVTGNVNATSDTGEVTVAKLDKVGSNKSSS